MHKHLNFFLITSSFWAVFLKHNIVDEHNIILRLNYMGPGFLKFT